MKTKISQARDLRQNMTDAEKKLWNKLRNRQFHNCKFRRQVPKGPYILDFYCAEKNLVIEVDGGQHYLHDHIKYDEKRTAYLQQEGLRILRYSNLEILKGFDSVLRDILNHINF